MKIIIASYPCLSVFIRVKILLFLIVKRAGGLPASPKRDAGYAGWVALRLPILSGTGACGKSQDRLSKKGVLF
jgi:hypothetical protein